MINYCGDWNLPLGKYFFNDTFMKQDKKYERGTMESLAPSPVIIYLGSTPPRLFIFHFLYILQNLTQIEANSMYGISLCSPFDFSQIARML